MILILEYTGESKDSKDGILQDAQKLQVKFRKKNQSDKLCKDISDFSSYMALPESKHENKLHVVCHGNRGQIGDLNGGQLAALLWDAGLEKRPNIKFITIHSCESGWEYTNPENNSWTPPMIWQIAAYFSTKSVSMVVKGAAGLSITDSQGHNFILKDGQSWPVGENMTRERELNLIDELCLAKGVARPKYATFYGTEAIKL